MKKSLYILILTALAATSYASKVTNVELSYLNGEAVARIDVSGQIRFTHQTEIPKDGKPDRVIVDILSATHELGGKVFEHLPVCPVTAVRTSQYAVTPESVVRVVFDMKKTPIYQVETKGQSILIHFADKTAAPFPTWSTAQYLTPLQKPAVPVAVTSKTDLPGTAGTPATTAQKNTQAENDRLVSLSTSTVSKPVATTQPTQPSADKSAPSVAKPSTPVPTVTAIPKSELKPVESKASTPATTIINTNITKPTASVTSSSAQPTTPAAPAKPMVTPPTPATTSSPSQAAPLVAAAPKSEIKPTAPAAQISPAPNVAIAPAKPTTSPATPTIANTPSGVKSVTPAIPSITTPDSSAPTGKPATPASTPEPKPVPAPSPSTTPAATTNSPVLPAPVAPTTETPKTSPAPADVTPTEKAATTDKSAAVAGEKPYTVSDDIVPEPEDLEPAEDNPYVDHDTPAGAEWADEPATDSNSTARFRRHPVSASKIKGTMIAQFPQRLVIKYASNGTRDPFETLINDTKTVNTPTQQGIPNVDGLRLVGVIISRQGGNRALLQDKGGLSYMMESGDKVRNGYVLRIETDRVYFQVFEYGWSRTIALKIAES